MSTDTRARHSSHAASTTQAQQTAGTPVFQRIGIQAVAAAAAQMKRSAEEAPKVVRELPPLLRDEPQYS